MPKKKSKSKKKNGLVIFSGNSNPKLAEEVADLLGVGMGDIIADRFPEGEIHVQIQENIRGKDVFIIQSTCSNPNKALSSPNDHLMELLIMIDAAKRASAKRITAVLPFFGYARQDRKDRPRVPITAKLAADLLTSAGANRVLSMDLHAGQIQGFFDIPVDHLYSINVLGDYFKKKGLDDLVVVSPDVGGIKRARAYAKLLKAPLAIVDKRRESDSKTSVMHIIGSVEGKNAVIVDDIISTGGSLVEAVKAIQKKGAKDVYAAIVHPILAGPAIQRINESSLKELIVSNSIPFLKSKSRKIKSLSVADLLADAINRIHNNQSVSSLFRKMGVEA